jgi:3-methyladenine DNA glycosylase AlkD
MHEIISKVRNELQAASSESTRITGQRFFREEVNLYGIRADDVRRISKANFDLIKHLSRQEIFSLCDTLWKSGMIEETFVACMWSEKLTRQFTPDDFRLLEKWVHENVNNWASCDTLCNHTVGDFIQKYPACISSLKQWAMSDNRWVRRASAVTLIIPARKGKFLSEIFEIATVLLEDKDDMVQKGYGWMLKAASQSSQKEVFDFVMKNKHLMPRTALRYAIEKMPAGLRSRAMEK